MMMAQEVAVVWWRMCGVVESHARRAVLERVSI